MKTNRLHIKNMVCDRCIKVVRDELEKLGYSIENIKLGEADLVFTGKEPDLDEIRSTLENNGFELLDDRKTQLIEKIKTTVVDLIHHQKTADLKVNTSDYIAEKVGADYNYLSHLFSAAEGITIEKYLILQRIEKVKELLVYNELSLKEIAFNLGYSSVAHLSNQFKKVTGLTTSHFKELKEKKRKTIDKI